MLSCTGDSSPSQAPPQTSTSSPETPGAQTEKPGDQKPENEPYKSGQLPISKEKVSFTYWWPFTSTYITGLNESYGTQEMEKRTNVRIEWAHPSIEQSHENLNLMFASQDLTDFIWLRDMKYPTGNEDAVDQGIFIKLNDLIDKYAPTYKNRYLKNPQSCRPKHAVLLGK